MHCARSVALLITLVSCTDSATPEAEILAVLGKAELAAESRDLGDIRPLIADEYSDRRGYDKKEIEKLLRLLFVTHQSIHILVHVESIDFTTQDVVNTIALVGMADTAETLPNVDLYQFDVRLVKRGNKQWQVVEADWRRGLGKAPAAKSAIPPNWLR